MPTTIEQVFPLLSSGKTARLTLPIPDSEGQRRILCVYQHEEPPEFSLLVPPSALPLNNIDDKRKSTVLFDVGGKDIIIGAEFKEIVNDQAFRFIAREVLHHDQLRNYFRVDVSASLVARPALTEASASEEPWNAVGETIDVSGSGILAIFPQSFKLKQNVLVKLVLPCGSPKPVKAIAKVIRTRKITDDKHHIALHFIQIEPEDRDKIMACCFKVQRQHLRLRVQVKSGYLKLTSP